MEALHAQLPSAHWYLTFANAPGVMVGVRGLYKVERGDK
jgi:hypothetical protein